MHTLHSSSTVTQQVPYWRLRQSWTSLQLFFNSRWRQSQHQGIHTALCWKTSLVLAGLLGAQHCHLMSHAPRHEVWHQDSALRRENRVIINAGFKNKNNKLEKTCSLTPHHGSGPVNRDTLHHWGFIRKFFFFFNLWWNTPYLISFYWVTLLSTCVFAQHNQQPSDIHCCFLLQLRNHIYQVWHQVWDTFFSHHTK